MKTERQVVGDDGVKEEYNPRIERQVSNGANENNVPRSLLRMEEVAERLNVSLARAYALARMGIIETVSLGRQKRVDPLVLERFIANGGKKLSGG